MASFVTAKTYLEDCERLNVSGSRNMRTSAQIDKRTASVDSAQSTVRNSLVDEIPLVLAVVEHFEELILGHFQTLKGLLLLDNGVGQSFQGLLVLLLNDLAKTVTVSDLQTSPIVQTKISLTSPCWPYRSRIQGGRW